MKKIKSFYKRYLHNFIGFSFLIAFLLNLYIETFASKSLFGGVLFLFDKPVVFFCNTLLIFGFLSIAMMFRHKLFIFSIIGVLWFALGTVNGVVLGSRMTPLNTFDILELGDALSLATTYMSKVQIGLLILGIVAILAGLVFLFLKAPKSKEKINYKRAIAGFLLIVMIITGVMTIAIKSKTLETYFPNLPYGYEDNGFAYCFLATWIAKGVSKPAEYSEEGIKNLFDKGELASSNNSDDTPNIIFLQLESFMDPLLEESVEMDKDPIPNIRKLMNSYSSGKFMSPAVGAGTANVEFEAMTGMSIKYFGPGEYPYKSILQKETVESIPYNLKDLGYRTHALHNHRGAFYERNHVFSNLGFDTFTSMEYMTNLTRTAKNWNKDYVLTDQIMNTLKSDEQKDYIYAISVQGHGQYPREETIKDPEIKVTKAPNEDLKWAWEYYVNQVYEMDDFVGELVKELENYPEPVVLVFYGDHIPAIENLKKPHFKDDRSFYETDYVIWDNFGMKKVDKDMKAYRIGAELLDRLDIHDGTLTKYHQNHFEDSGYLEGLHALQYDMLYGKKYIYDGKSPFPPVNMKMGIDDIKINEVVEVGGQFYLKGENFTQFSKVNLDGKILKTDYVGPTLLRLSDKVDPKDVGKMKVSQVEKTKKVLSTSE